MSIKYLIRRLLFMIPTLVFIAVVIFFLGQLNKDDAQLVKFEKYKSTHQLRSGLNGINKDELPSFYFTFYRKSSSDTLYKISNSLIRKNLEELAWNTGSWSYSNQLYLSIKKLLKKNEISNHKKSEIVQLLINGNFKPLFVQLSTYYPHTNFANQYVKHEQSNKIDNYIPVFKYHGTQNAFHEWMVSIATGNLGTSEIDGVSASHKISSAIGWTLLLSVLSLIISLVAAFTFAVWSSVMQRKWLTQLMDSFFLCLYSIPNFWLATLLIVFFASGEYFNWFPTYGYGYSEENHTVFENLYSKISHLFLPLICLSYASTTYFYQFLSTSIRQELKKEYVQTARAKGFKLSKIIFKHVLKNASFPLITMVGSIVPALISGSFIVEYIFAIPGMGKLSVNALFMRDYQVLYAILLMAAVLSFLGILLADFLYHLADPRLQPNVKSNVE